MHGSSFEVDALSSFPTVSNGLLRMNPLQYGFCVEGKLLACLVQVFSVTVIEANHFKFLFLSVTVSLLFLNGSVECEMSTIVTAKQR